jgi:hypothetical protein
MRNTIESITKSIADQKFIPRQTVFRDSNHGQVDVVVYNILGDDGNTVQGEPFARFEAERIDNTGWKPKPENRKVFTNLVEALRFIDIY